MTQADDEATYSWRYSSGPIVPVGTEVGVRTVSAWRLRQAARRMRELADNASEAPWTSNTSVKHDAVVFDKHGEWVSNIARGSERTGVVAFDQDEGNSDYIAAMHPGVARSVADWLDLVARLLSEGFDANAETEAALNVARTFLGTAR